MERHNIIQFLQNDSRKEDPAGYENHLRNLFDPDDNEHQTQDHELVNLPGREVETRPALIGRKPPANRPGDDEASSQAADEAVCARRGCCRKPRFDSLFCSDSCGVAELERDLLRSFFIADEMHPSLLRT